ncbi:MAG: transglutaminase domain-containing protein [Acidobacteria bacterium]|nr:transglutaminase domain-containing protein [Acidobacteriota bacterium]
MSKGFAAALLVAGLAGLVAGAAEAAVIASRTVELTPDGDGYLERQELTVRLVEVADTGEWQRYPILLDEDIELVDLTAEVLAAGGRVRASVPKRKLVEEGGVGDSLYSSSRLTYVPFPVLEVGESLHVVVTRRHRPVFPAALVVLDLGEATERLRVDVAPGFPGLRWHLQAPADRFEVDTAGGGLEVTARDLPRAARQPYVPDGDRTPHLHVAWGPDATWPAVGRWYDGFAPMTPEPAPEIRTLAARLTAGAATPRAKVEALTRHVQERVRYEAVQIGEGGWRPSPPVEVVGRGWGDCKDKSRLLLDLLRAAGIEGHMALLRAGFGEAVAEDLPSPFQFNHAIVAVPAEAAGALATDPVANGLLWIDPTATRGGVGWLLPTSQDRMALVVDGGASRLLHIPKLVGAEELGLELDGVVAEDGGFSGTARVVAKGNPALGWLSNLEGHDAVKVEDDLASLVRRRAPGAKLGEIRWGQSEGDVPAVTLEVPVSVPSLVRGEPGHRWLRPGSLEPLPEPRILDGRVVPVALSPGLWRTSWRLALPAGWCRSAPDQSVLDNPVGRWLDRLSIGDDGRLLLDREVEIRTQRAEGEGIASLAELAIAENRAARSRVRLRCGGEAQPPASTSR